MRVTWIGRAKMRLVMLLATIIAGCTHGPTTSDVTQADINCPSGDCPECPTPESPIIVDLDGDGLALTSPDDGVMWTLRPGELSQWAWVAARARDAFLVLDINANGRVDDGTEMFGNLSPQDPSDEPNGFSALRYHDSLERGGNVDGVIDARDAVWPRLRLWADTDHNAVSEPLEMQTLDAAGVYAFPLDTVIRADRTDEHGNEYRFSAPIVASAPVAQFVTDVWLAPGAASITRWVCEAWVLAHDDWSGNRRACTFPLTANDPTITHLGTPYKLVVRTGSATRQSNAMASATFAVRRDVDPDMAAPGCLWGITESDTDPYKRGPYQAFGTPNTWVAHEQGPGPHTGGIPRIKCQLVTEPGGGCIARRGNRGPQR